MGGWALKADQVQHWAYQTKVLTPEQCKWVIDYCKKKGTRAASIDILKP